MILRDIAMLAVGNRRSISYLKELMQRDYLPSFALVLSTEGNRTPGQKDKSENFEFLDLLQKAGIDYLVCPTADINSADIIAILSGRPETYFIYSGPGGAILRHDILSLGKEFLHIHAGRIPEFKGSTTIYYQLLVENKCSATAIFLRSKIDEGPVIATREFEPPLEEEIDYEYDPKIRALLLGDVIELYTKTGFFETCMQNDDGESYYIMHPVLRHITVLYMR